MAETIDGVKKLLAQAREYGIDCSLKVGRKKEVFPLLYREEKRYIRPYLIRIGRSSKQLINARYALHINGIYRYAENLDAFEDILKWIRLLTVTARMKGESI